MEFVRVFKSVWKILVLLTVSIIALCIFKIQNSNDTKVYFYYDDMIKSYKEIEYENISKSNDRNDYNDKTIESLVYKDVKKDIVNNSDREYIEKANSLFYDTVDYINTYKDKMSNDIGRARDVLSFSLYSDKNNFGRLNTIKYANDMLKVKDISVTLGNTTAIEKLLDFHELSLLFLLILLAILISFMEESYNGMGMIIRTGVHGRFHLVLKRCLVLWVFIALMTLILNGIVFLIFLSAYGGNMDLLYAIQSSQIFRLFPYHINVIQFFFVYNMCFTLGMYGIGVFMYLILLLIRSNKFSIVAMIGIIAAEYLLYNKITSNSSLCILKYINLFWMIIPGASYMKYANWGYNGFVTDISESTLIITFVVIIVCMTCVLFIYTFRHSSNEAGWIKKIQDNLVRIFQKYFSKTSTFIMELYKVMILQRGIFIILIAIYMISNSKLYRGVDYSQNNSYLTNFYNMFEGRVPDESMNTFIQNVQSKIDELKSRDNVTGIEKWKLSDMQTAVEEMNKSVEYITRIGSEQKIEAVIVNPMTYYGVLGEKNDAVLENINFICALAVILIISGGFAFERKSGMIELSRISSRRERIWYHKAMIVFLVVLAVWGISAVLNWRNICNLYDLRQIKAPIQSLEIYETFPVKTSIAGYVVISQILRLIQLLGIGYLVFGISIYFDYIRSIFVSLIILVPHMLYLFRVPFMSNLSIVILLDFSRCWRQYGNSIVKYLLCFILMILSVILCIESFKKWNGLGGKIK